MPQAVRYLLDTNVVSEWTKPAPNPRVIEWLDTIDEDRVGISVVTLAEIRRGIDRLPAGRKRRRLDDWLVHDLVQRFDGRIFNVDEAAADAWGRASARATAAGRSPGEIDAMIAGIALAHDLVVVTRNVQHFEPFGTEVFNPWE